jgi:hypothetical protein
VDHLKSENSSAKDYVDGLIGKPVGEIHTATLRELFILNEAHRTREEIWGHVDRMLPLTEADKGCTRDGGKAATGVRKGIIHSKELTDVVCKLAYLFI